MKKLLLITGGLLLLISTTEAATDQTIFLNKIEDAIYMGSRSGKLTKREVRILHTELNIYEKILWKYEANAKISRRERKKLRRIEVILNRKLDTALYNQKTVRGAKKRGKAKVRKAKKRKRNNDPICRMPSRNKRNDKY